MQTRFFDESIGKHRSRLRFVKNGHVQFISNGVDVLTWQALGSRAGSETVADF
jgi:hypothetical protein